ncbi:MAG: BMP family ABC transporter substrate-binding protein [Carboxydocellales bacterium]
MKLANTTAKGLRGTSFRPYPAVIVIIIGLLFTLISSGCLAKQQKQVGKSVYKSSTEKVARVGVVLASGGPKEQLLNQSVGAALKRAGEAFGTEYLVLEHGELASAREAMNYLANNGYHLILGLSSAQTNDLVETAKEFPDLLFAMLDEEIQGPNIVAVTFREEESAFLAGALAALLTKTNIVAFIGGADVPAINRQEKGYKAGVDYVNKLEQRNIPVQVKADYAGMFAKAFKDPDKGKAMALADIDYGADIIFQAAGNTGDGVLAAAAERGIKAIGSGPNQNVLFPGTVLTSTMKIMDQGIYQILEDFTTDNLKSGKRSLGIKQGAVDLIDLKSITPAENAALANNAAGLAALKAMKDSIPPEVVDKLNIIRDQLTKGNITVDIGK